MYVNGIKTYFNLKSNLKKPLSELKEMQWRSFRDLVEFAYRQVSIYRHHFAKTGFSLENLRDPSDIPNVPTTTKSLFQQADAQDLISDQLHIEKLVRKRTSGSSGSPLDVYYTPEDRIYRTILHLRILFYNGMRFRDKMAHISDDRNVPDFRYSFQRLGFLPKEFVYAADSAGDQLDRLAAIDPAVIYSYASSMVLLASEVETQGSCPIKPKIIFTTGELLNSDDRALIERAFSTKIRDIYGVVEMADVAWECPAGEGYHINIDSFHVEVLNDGKPALPGEPGKLVITNLHSYAMPFIRYEVGDVVTAPIDDPCSCGCTFPRIGVLQGRADDWLYKADGSKVSPLIFVVASIKGVLQYRMIQKAYDQLAVEILPGPDYTDDTLPDVKKHVLEVMGSGVNVEVVKVDIIPQKSGKMRRVISEIESSP
ncbi:hypothetical protein CEE37_03065 [candidate division LCP-89 bacterium B3_LCP]|uniref:Phenylacetate--CoA ligase family protein n=1 Tax=candidate division LCP-89 bacterium B3_LCP TaxID=2012998 RepID=A0A532V2W2_UNCL8|nr:MAG: hypothetical protein CEE37_03065 [candidate division LCP-89 bacterium B3_LCP]